jgi:hypothetical protein
MKYNYQQIKQFITNKGYSWFEEGDYNLNIVGIRSNQKNQITNKFDDFLTISYQIGGIQQYHEYPITTEPGIYYTQNLLDKKGVAIMVPGQYKNTWRIGLHQGKYEALTQIKSIKVYRDKDKDKEYDLNPETINEGIFGINIHHAGADSQQIDKWSAGCQVFKRLEDFNIFINICKKASKIWGNLFTYTLIDG